MQSSLPLTKTKDTSSKREDILRQIENLNEQLAQTKMEVIEKNCKRTLAILQKQIKNL